MNLSVNGFWFRRDLRLHDNAELYQALKSSKPVVPVFIFDNIPDELEDRANGRVEFIHNALSGISGYSIPIYRQKKFDPELKYIRKWVPESEEMTYLKPIVDHELARKRFLKFMVKC